MDQLAREQLEDLAFVQLKAITDVTVARHLNISTDEANKILKEFHDLHKKGKNILAVYTVKGEILRNGSTIRSTIMAQEDKLEEVKLTFTKVSAVNLFALHKDPIDITSILAHDSLEDADFFREDGQRAGISSVQVREFREEMETQNKEAFTRQKAIFNGGHAYVATTSNQPKKEIKKEEKTMENIKMTNLFQKACDRQKTPKSSPTKVARDSPFSSAERKGEPDSAGSSTKKRARKIIIDSEDEISPPKKLKAPEDIKKEITPEKERTPVKTIKKEPKTKKKTSKLFTDDDLFEAESPEKSPPTKPSKPTKPKKDKKQANKVIKTEEDEPLRRSPRENTAPPGKRIVKRKEMETFMDEDGFLVTKEVIKEIEVDVEEAPPKPFSPKKTNEVPAKSKPIPIGQSKISSFFTKK